jgi:hypothetical protein
MSDCAPGDECIGPFVVGEKPAPILYQFLDEDGAALPITGYAAKFSCREQWGLVTKDGAAATLVSGPLGKVEYDWDGTEFPVPGHYLAELWVGNGTNRFASVLIKFDARSPVASVPAI